MEDAVTTAARTQEAGWLTRFRTHARAETPSITEWIAAISSALFLVLSFPDFDLFFLAWIGLVPLLFVISLRPLPGRAFVLGWVTGSLFFYGSCYWLTYSMIRYGGLSALVAYLLLVPGALIVGIFPALFATFLALAIRRWGPVALLLASLIWPAMEWSRLQVTGQLWNAIGYSQAEAYGGLLIQSARWGGVYLIGSLILAVNAGLTFLILRRTPRAILIPSLTISLAAAVVVVSIHTSLPSSHSGTRPDLNVVALQPNVPMSPVKTAAEIQDLLQRHLTMTIEGLRTLPADVPRLVIWPESPMNFSYASEGDFRDLVTKFAQDNHTSILFNSLEPAPNDGAYNSALLINEEGRLIAQYDKIRLMPFGEYVPLPHWLPGASLITAIVGDFTPGSKYVLLPVGSHRAGVFICIESAYPSIARQFASEGADVLINISNDGYLGPTAVMRQHLANAIFRAVENGRPLLRVANTGLTASIRADGSIEDRTLGFQPAVRTWTISGSLTTKTFYTKHGDLFAQISMLATLITVMTSLSGRKRSIKNVR